MLEYLLGGEASMWQDFYVPGARTKAQGSASCLWQVMPKHWCVCMCVYVFVCLCVCVFMCKCVCVVVVIVVNKSETCVLLLTPDPIAAAVATASLDNPACIRNDAPVMLPL